MNKYRTGFGYIDLCIDIFVEKISRHQWVKTIILNGSYARNDFIKFKSDLDLSIILRGNANKNEFICWYSKQLNYLCFICPYLLPKRERIKNVFIEDELQSHLPNTYCGYLSQEQFIVVYGDIPQYQDKEIDRILYLENKIANYLRSRGNKKKLEKLLMMINQRSKPLDSTVISQLKFIKTHEGFLLQYPIILKRDLYFKECESIESMILDTFKFIKNHPLIESIHYCAPWIIYNDSKIKVIHQSRIPQIITGSAENFKEWSEDVINQDIEILKELYFEDFVKYKPSFKSDFITKKFLIESNIYFELFKNKQQPTSIQNLTFNELLGKLLYSFYQINKQHVNISLCICTKDRENSLMELIESIEKSSDIPEEILIINNGKSWSEELVNKIHKHLRTSTVRIIESRLDNISKLRNLAIKEAKHEVISFVDDDCILTTEWIQKVRIHFAVDTKLNMLGGKVIHYRQDKKDINELFHRSYLSSKQDHLC